MPWKHFIHHLPSPTQTKKIYTLPRSSRSYLSLLWYSSLPSVLPIYLFWLEFVFWLRTSWTHCINRKRKMLTLALCLSHLLRPHSAQTLLTHIQGLETRRVRTADVDQASEELRALVMAIKAALDRNDKWGLIYAGITLILQCLKTTWQAYFTLFPALLGVVPCLYQHQPGRRVSCTNRHTRD